MGQFARKSKSRLLISRSDNRRSQCWSSGEVRDESGRVDLAGFEVLKNVVVGGQNNWIEEVKRQQRGWGRSPPSYTRSERLAPGSHH